MNQLYTSADEALDVAAQLGFFHQAVEFDFAGKKAAYRLSANPEDRNDPRLAWARKEGAGWRLSCTSASRRILRGEA